MLADTRQVFLEDLLLYDCSAYYAAFFDGEMIGSIKVSLWDGRLTLPLEKLFGIDCHCLPYFPGRPIWHIGRLAISKKKNPIGLSLLKRFLTLAIYSICRHSNDSVMVAECDQKLLRILNALGIRTMTLAPGIQYLGSETIPVCSTNEWLEVFLRNNEHVRGMAQI